MDFNGSLFGQQQQHDVNDTLEKCDVIFVADMFASDYGGGAELTTQAIIDGSDKFTVAQLHCRDVNMALLEKLRAKYWVFCNIASLDWNIIPAIAFNLRYSVIAYDYSYCRHRSEEKHFSVESKQCSCFKEQHGGVAFMLYACAKSVWFMSDAQRNLYLKRFPDLERKDHTRILSSILSRDTINEIVSLKNSQILSNDSWIVFGSDSWIKGTKNAEEYCKKNDLRYEIVSNLSHSDFLKKLISARGFVYMPVGADTCPRAVIEAKLLDCELRLNEHVQHANERWFSAGNFESIRDFMLERPSIFWKQTERDMRTPTISGYVTTFDCLRQNYPIRACIESMLGFCDEIIVVDSGSTDGTLKLLENLSISDSRIKFYVRKFDKTVTEGSHCLTEHKKRTHVLSAQQISVGRWMPTK